MWTSTLLELSTKIQHPSRGFKFSVSLSTLNFDFPLCELVTKEAIKNWLDKSCASFLYKLYLQWIIGKFACCIQTQFACCIPKRKKLFTDLFNSAIIQRGGLSLVNQTSTFYFVDQVLQDLIKEPTVTNFMQNDFVPIIPVGADCKHKQKFLVV